MKIDMTRANNRSPGAGHTLTAEQFDSMMMGIAKHYAQEVRKLTADLNVRLGDLVHQGRDIPENLRNASLIAALKVIADVAKELDKG